MSDNALQVQTVKAMTAGEVGAQKALIQKIMAAVMKSDVHYGVIPGTKKNTLYKAGSEAILSTFRIAVDPIVHDLGNEDVIRYRVHARGILPDGSLVGVGIGECSSSEEKYRWRGAVCQEEFDETPENRRRIKYVAKWNNKTRQKDDIDKIRQVRTEPADIANTVLKMAKKRAQIDLTLTATGASDIFDQDLEDLPQEIREELVGQEVQHSGKPVVVAPQPKQESGGKTVTENQVKMLYVKCKQADIDEVEFCKHFSIDCFEALPFAKVNDALKAIQSGEIAA